MEGPPGAPPQAQAGRPPVADFLADLVQPAPGRTGTLAAPSAPKCEKAQRLVVLPTRAHLSAQDMVTHTNYFYSVPYARSRPQAVHKR